MKKQLKLKYIGVIFVMALAILSSLITTQAEASGIEGIKSFVVEKKILLTSQYQSYSISLEDNTGITQIQLSYSLPNGGHNTIYLNKNASGYFVGSGMVRQTGDHTVRNIMLLSSDGYKNYGDIGENGEYELGEGDFTSYSTDTSSPILDSISVDTSQILSGGTVSITVVAHDDLSNINNVNLEYKMPNGNHIQLVASSIGDNKYRVKFPYHYTGGASSIGEFECVSINLTDAYNNMSSYLDYSYYSTRDLNGGNFFVKPEAVAPVLKSISVDKKEIYRGKPVKIIAEVEDASGVKDVKVTYKDPNGYSNTFLLTHSYGNIYEAEIPGFITSYSIGNWRISHILLNDIYENSTTIFNSTFYSWGQNLTGGDFYVREGDTTPPAKPTINHFYDNSYLISGWAEPYSRINAFAEGNYIGSVYVYSGGYFYLYVPLQKAGTNLAITATDEFGNVSEQTNVVVKDGTPPWAPYVNEVTDKSHMVEGQGEVDSTITISAEGNVLTTAKANERGYFNVNIPLQAAGTRLFITATDSSGNISGITEIVVKDVTAPDIPVAYSITDSDTQVLVRAESGATINAKVEGKIIGTSYSNGYSYYWISIPRQKAGTIVYITATDFSGNQSEAASVIVSDATSPTITKVEEVSDKSTNVSGEAEVGSLITIVRNAEILGTAKVNSQGRYSVVITKQPAGANLEITATDDAGNTSDVINVIVVDTTAPYIPTVFRVTEYDTAITGRAESNSLVKAKVDGKLIGDSYADENSNFSMNIPLQKAGVKISITAIDSSGNESDVKIATVLDTTAPEVPTAEDFNDKSDSVAGVAEAGSRIIIRTDVSELGTEIANAEGSYLIAIPKQLAGTKLFITATDDAGNISNIKEVTVKDATPPNAPQVNEVTDQSTILSGIAEQSAKVTIHSGESVIETGIADEKGIFGIKIPKQAAATKLTVTATDEVGNTSNATEVIVKDVTIPILSNIDEITDKSTIMTGMSEAGSTVTVKIGDKVIGTGTVNIERKYSVEIPKLSAGTKVMVTVTDEAGNTSEAKEITVKDVTEPEIFSIKEVIENTTRVEGKAEAKSLISIKIDSIEIGSAFTTSTGDYSVEIAKQKAGTKLTITAADEAGNVSELKEVMVLDITAPETPTVNEVTDSSSSVTGLAETGSTITVKAGSTVLGNSTVNGEGKYSVAIPKQKAGTKLTVASIDQADNESEVKEVTVIDVTAPIVSNINAVTENSITVTGLVEAGSVVSVKSGITVLGTGNANVNGIYTVTIPKQKVGTKLTVTATDNAGNMSEPKEVVVTDATAPTVPTVYSVYDNAVSITGKAEAGAKVYAKVGNKVIGEGTAANGTFTIKISKQLTGSSISVYAVDLAGNESTAVKTTVAEAAIKVASTAYNKMKISWSQVPGVHGYEIYRSTSSTGAYSKVAAVTSGSTLSYTNENLATGKTYYYKVKPYQTIEGVKVYSGYSDSAYAKTVLATVTSAKAASAGYSKNKVSWSQVSGATGYEVLRSTSKTGTYSNVKTVTSGSTLSYENTGLTSGKAYYYKVRAYRTVDGVKVYSLYSGIVSAVPALASPSKLTAAKASSTSIKASWSKVSEASGYELYRATSKTGTYTKVKTQTSSSLVSFTNTGLSKGKTYYYKVRAYRIVNGKKVYSPYTTIVSTNL